MFHQCVKLARKPARPRTGKFSKLPVLTKSCPSALFNMLSAEYNESKRYYIFAKIS